MPVKDPLFILDLDSNPLTRPGRHLLSPSTSKRRAADSSEGGSRDGDCSPGNVVVVRETGTRTSRTIHDLVDTSGGNSGSCAQGGADRRKVTTRVEGANPWIRSADLLVFHCALYKRLLLGPIWSTLVLVALVVTLDCSLEHLLETGDRLIRYLCDRSEDLSHCCGRWHSHLR